VNRFVCSPFILILQVNHTNFALSFLSPQQLADTSATSAQGKNPFPMALMQSPVTDDAERLKGARCLFYFMSLE
jgi:hypothetical protein